MQGVPGHRASLPPAHDHHLRMLDMAAFLNQGPDAGLILDQYNRGFAPAFCSPPFAGAHIDHHHQSTLINGLMKVETLEGAAGEQSAVTNVTSASGEVSGYSSSCERETTTGDGGSTIQPSSMAINSNRLTAAVKARRKLPGMPDPDAEVIALSPKTLLATNRFVCEICNKGFQRDQNLQLHRRGHNLPWKLKQRDSKEPRKKVYVCPETACVHHDPARALGDLTGIKKHFSRKHGEKKWKCDKCSKRYAVQSDWKAHSKTCGTREYRCDCGTLFSRRDSFITHRAFCDALAEESAIRVNNNLSGGSCPDLPNTGMTTFSTASCMIGGGDPTSSTHALKSHGLLESSSFESNNQQQQQLVLGAMATTPSSSRTRLPLWLSHAAPGSINDYQQLIGNPNLPLNPTLLDSYNGNIGGSGTGSSHFYSNSGLLPAAATSLGHANGLMYGSNVSQFGLVGNSSNGNFAGMSSFNGGLTAFPSLCSNQALTSPSSAQMSATSLLQRAAEMGSVSTSNPSLFKGSCFASSHHNSNPILYWPAASSISNQGSANHGLSSVGVNVHSFNGGGFAAGDKASPRRSNIIMDSGRSNIDMDNTAAAAAGIQEMLSSFNGGASSAGFFMGGNLSSTATSTSAMVNNLPILLSTESPISQQLALFNHGSSGSKHASMGLPLGVKGEDAAAPPDNFTRDFLGVRGDNGILESMAKSLSQKDQIGMDHYIDSNSKENLSSDEENMSSSPL